MSYLHERRRRLGGYMPSRKAPAERRSRRRRSSICKESLEGSAGREVSSTMALRARADAADEASGDRQARGADHSR